MIGFSEVAGGHTHQTWGQFNSGIEIDYLKKMELINLELELKFPTKKLNPEINLLFLQR